MNKNQFPKSVLLKVENVTKRFGGVSALDKVSFSVGHGKIVSLIGPNGAGKTTLFNCLTGVSAPEAAAWMVVARVLLNLDEVVTRE